MGPILNLSPTHQHFLKEPDMLKKLIVFAITSGLAAKAYKAYAAKKAATPAATRAPVAKRPPSAV